MALPSTIYRSSIQLSHVDRNLYETLQITVARHPSETEERLVLRLLAFALCYEPDLAFTKGICAGDEPDLWVKGPDGRVLLWVEVGLPDPERLVKACRHATRAVLLVGGTARQGWERQHLHKLVTVRNLTVLGLDQGFLNQLADRLERSINWSLTVTEGSLYLERDGETLEAAVSHLSGPNPVVS